MLGAVVTAAEYLLFLTLFISYSFLAGSAVFRRRNLIYFLRGYRVVVARSL